MRRILHIDADAFFAAVEQRDNPRLRGKPVAVGSDSARGVVATASYEARRFGVGSAMPSRMARKRCPGLIFVPPRFSVYSEVGRQLRQIYARYARLVEPVSIDEAYLDASEPLIGPASGTLIAQRIRKDVLAETGLTVTAGVSYCKFLAKLASGMQKPDGLTVILFEEASDIIEHLPVERFHGVGPRTAERLHELGIRTGGDMKRAPLELLIQRFGKLGSHFHRLSHGIDERPVDPELPRRSVSSEDTFSTDLESIDELLAELPRIVASVVRRLQAGNTSGRVVSVKLKYSDHSIVTRQMALPVPIRTEAQIVRAASEVLRNRFSLQQPVRLLGVGVHDLVEGELIQPPVFPDFMP